MAQTWAGLAHSRKVTRFDLSGPGVMIRPRLLQHRGCLLNRYAPHCPVLIPPYQPCTNASRNSTRIQSETNHEHPPFQAAWMRASFSEMPSASGSCTLLLLAIAVAKVHRAIVFPVA